MTERNADLSWITSEMMNEMFERIVMDAGVDLLTVPGVYEAISEHFNNEAIQLVVDEHDPDGIKRYGENGLEE
jgi:hypothetical protein